MENLRYPEGAVGQNQTVTVGFSLKNVGKVDAKILRLWWKVLI